MAERSPQAVLTPQDSARYCRQIMLHDVGPVGQAAILAGRARVGGDELAERYARRAGVSVIAPGTIDLDELAPREIVVVPAARQVLGSARVALREIRDILERGAS